MTFDYTALGFYTFDCLGRPVSRLPPGADTIYIDEMALAVSGTAGAGAIVAAKYGLSVQAVGAIGTDDMGDWVLMKLGSFGIDTQAMQRIPDMPTSSSIIVTRPDGARPAFHRKGATNALYVDDAAFDRVLDTRILHVGGAGLMDRMDRGRTAEVMKAARARGCVTTLDVFASTPASLPLVEALLPHTDYFLPSEEEAGALSGRADIDGMADFLLDKGAGCVVLTLGADGALYRHRDGTRFMVPAFAIDVVCSCGCGDSFNAGFATGLHIGLDAESSVRFAQATAAQTAMGLGSQAVVRSLADTEAFIRSMPTRA